MYAASTSFGMADRSSASRTTGTTSYLPRPASASAMFFPLCSDTSRSLEVPPINTAIFFIAHIIPNYARAGMRSGGFYDIMYKHS